MLLPAHESQHVHQDDGQKQRHTPALRGAHPLRRGKAQQQARERRARYTTQRSHAARYAQQRRSMLLAQVLVDAVQTGECEARGAERRGEGQHGDDLVGRQRSHHKASGGAKRRHRLGSPAHDGHVGASSDEPVRPRRRHARREDAEARRQQRVGRRLSEGRAETLHKESGQPRQDGELAERVREVRAAHAQHYARAHEGPPRQLVQPHARHNHVLGFLGGGDREPSRHPHNARQAKRVEHRRPSYERDERRRRE
mmetsp:Transcript_2209/g.8780  ORF Transcript_2209/g.8780 Transcript_2209/m.8780 type:complete len:255 (-) Transcript_2209:613-1377(-)